MYVTANYAAGHKRIMGYAASNYSVNSFYHRVLDISSCADTALEDIDRCANLMAIQQPTTGASSRHPHHGIRHAMQMMSLRLMRISSSLQQIDVTHHHSKARVSNKPG